MNWWALTCASLPPCGCADPSRNFEDFVSDDFVPIVCCMTAFILCIMPPEPLCVLLPLALLSLSIDWALANSRSFRLASDFERGRNTSNIVGRRFGLAMPWTVDWFITWSPSPLFRRSNEFERLFFDLKMALNRTFIYVRFNPNSEHSQTMDLLLWFQLIFFTAVIFRFVRIACPAWFDCTAPWYMCFINRLLEIRNGLKS